MDTLQIIDEREVFGKQFRIFGTLESPLFLAKDVAEWIEHSNSRVMLNTVDEDEKVVSNVYTHGGTQESWFLTEDGLYEVLMQSRKPIAKQFKKKVKEILKQIRQTGGYIPVVEDDSEEEILAKAVLVAQKTIEKKNQIITSQQKQLEEQQPLVSFAEICMQSNQAIKVGELAKMMASHGIDTGQKRLFNKLREWGLVFKASTEPTQKAVEQGYFEIAQGVKQKPNGEAFTWRTPYITPKGQVYIVDRLKKEESA